MKKRILIMFLVLTVTISLIACGKKDALNEADGPSGTLVIGTGAFNGVFSPFFYQTAYDAQGMELIFSSVCELDSDNELTDKAGHIESELIEVSNYYCGTFCFSCFVIVLFAYLVTFLGVFMFIIVIYS